MTHKLNSYKIPIFLVGLLMLAIPQPAHAWSLSAVWTTIKNYFAPIAQPTIPLATPNENEYDQFVYPTAKEAQEHDKWVRETLRKSPIALDAELCKENPDAAVVERRLKAGAKLNALVNDERPLVRAAAKNRTDLVQLLTDHKAQEENEYERDKNKKTALMHAAVHGNLEMTNILLAHGANPAAIY